ncbi:MAG: tRNA (N6-isopentenyl adenosine(37)-C2)-methylthiotransferase MiaB [Bacillota bacterium]
MKQYYIQTFGCQMNEHDSENLAGILRQMGYAQAERMEEADLILFNTCCVRGNAENRAYGNIGNLKRLKKAKPHLIIGVCGCMPQQPMERAKILRSYPHVDLIFGTHNLHCLPDLLAKAESVKTPVEEIWDEEGAIKEGLPVQRASKLKAWVTIIYGCNNFCAYCVVPYVRGRERSRQPQMILDEISGLVQDGVKEVTLLGQNVNSYGKDLYNNTDFPGLLAEINKIPGDFRIRFTTSHPKDLSEKLIQTMADSEKVCEHLHLPVQAGSDRILSAMNRCYSRDQYLDLVAHLRDAIPAIALTTDLIVGFPGETEEDFEETLDLVERVRFDGAFTFAYSPRMGTTAADLPDQIPDKVKSRRLYRLIEIQNRISGEINSQLAGKTCEVLVEGINRKNPCYLEGRTRGNKLALFTSAEESANLYGRFVPVKITAPQTWNLYGEQV